MHPVPVCISGSHTLALVRSTSWQHAVPTCLNTAPRAHRHCRSLQAAVTSEAALLDRPPKHEHHKKLKVLPRIQYSSDCKEVDYIELLELLLIAGLEVNRRIPADHAVVQERVLSREQLLQRVEHAVANSITVVIASVSEDKLPSYQDTESEASAVSKDDWSWVKTRRQRKKKKVLAGFARATGDCALTASIHDLVVLPELQGLGLGRKVLAKATNQVRSKTGTTDIGLAASPASYGFFGKCGFDLDKEESTFMTFAADRIQTSATDRLLNNTALLQLLAETAQT